MNTLSRPLKIALSTLVLCLPQAAHSQSPEVPPLEPLRAPNDAAWAIEIQYPAQREKDTALPQPARVKSVSVQKQKDVYQEIVAFDDGNKRERWVLSGIQFETSDGGKQVTRLLPGDSSASDYSETDFPELAWVVGLKPRVTEDNGRQILLLELNSSDRPLTRKEKTALSEMERLGGMYNELFAKKGKGKKPAGETLNPMGVDLFRPAGKLRLFVDLRTKLPLRFDSPTETRTYSYQSEVQPLHPPEHFKGAYESWREEIMASSRPTSMP